MLRVLALWASVAVVSLTAAQDAPDPHFIQGAWACIEAPSDSPAAADAEAQAQIDRVFPLEGARVADAHLAVGVRNDIDFSLGRLLTEMHFLRIGLSADRVVIVDDLGRNEYPLAGKAETHTVAGVGVHVTPMWTAPSLVLNIGGDYGLEVRETIEPSADGAHLVVRWDLRAPKTQLPLVVTRLYQRLSAEPPPPDRVIAGDLGAEVVAQPTGGVRLTEAFTRSLESTRPTIVLLAARPTKAVQVTLLQLTFGPSDLTDLRAPGAIQTVVGRGVRQNVGPSIELPIVNPHGAPYTSRYGTHPLGLTLDLSHGTERDRRHCVLPVRFDSASPYDAGQVTFSAGQGSAVLDGATHCGTMPEGFVFRLTYEHLTR